MILPNNFYKEATASNWKSYLAKGALGALGVNALAGIFMDPDSSMLQGVKNVALPYALTGLGGAAFLYGLKNQKPALISYAGLPLLGAGTASILGQLAGSYMGPAKGLYNYVTGENKNLKEIPIQTGKTIGSYVNETALAGGALGLLGGLLAHKAK